MALLDYILPAMFQAKLTGRSVMVPGLGLAVNPNGSIGTSGWSPRFAGRPTAFAGGPGTREAFVPQQGQSAWSPPAYAPDTGALPMGPQYDPTGAGYLGSQYARSGAALVPPAGPPSMPMPQDYGNTGFGTPAFAAAVTPPAAAGGPGSREAMVPQQAQSGVTPGATLSPLAITAARYRAAQGGGGGLTADQLNAASLAAAQAGRTFMQPGPYPSGGNVVANALVNPPGAPFNYGGTQYASNPLPPIY